MQLYFNAWDNLITIVTEYRHYLSDINKLKDGMSDKVAMAVQWMVAFLSGFIIAFCYEWRLSLVIMSTSPLLAISGFLFSKVSKDSVCTDFNEFCNRNSFTTQVYRLVDWKKENKNFSKSISMFSTSSV